MCRHRVKLAGMNTLNAYRRKHHRFSQPLAIFLIRDAQKAAREKKFKLIF
jgi:hypothetical protein